MKHFYFLSLLVFTFSTAFAQPNGATLYNPVQVGTLNAGANFTDTKNNSPANGYQNNIGHSSDDIYYKFTLANPAEVSISTCSSTFDTYLHLLSASGATIATNDDAGPLCATLQSSIKMQLAAGTYYAVTEGYSSYSGNITISIGIPAVEQEGEDPDGFAIKMQSVFQHIDPTPVTTGILMDVGLEFLNMDNYSGTAVLHDSNYVTNTHWRSIYGSLMSSQFNNQISFTNFPTLNNIVNNATGSNLPVAFMLLNYNYQAIRTDAISAGLISVSNEQLYDVPNRPYSPYQLKTSFAVAPAKEHIVAPSGYANFIFKPELMFGNTGKTISQIQVNMDDGVRVTCCTYRDSLYR